MRAGSCLRCLRLHSSHNAEQSKCTTHFEWSASSRQERFAVWERSLGERVSSIAAPERSLAALNSHRKRSCCFAQKNRHCRCCWVLELLT